MQLTLIFPVVPSVVTVRTGHYNGLSQLWMYAYCYCILLRAWGKQIHHHEEQIYLFFQRVGWGQVCHLSHQFQQLMASLAGTFQSPVPFPATDQTHDFCSCPCTSTCSSSYASPGSSYFQNGTFKWGLGELPVLPGPVWATLWVTGPFFPERACQGSLPHLPPHRQSWSMANGRVGHEFSSMFISEDVHWHSPQDLWSDDPRLWGSKSTDGSVQGMRQVLSSS